MSNSEAIAIIAAIPLTLIGVGVLLSVLVRKLDPDYKDEPDERD